MIVYDDAYRQIRLKYLLPISKYTVNYSSLKTTNIKKLLTKFTSVEKDNNGYVFYFDDDILLKALLGDIELFYIKTIIHKQDVYECDSIDLSANWNIVTHYYYSFFCASLMLRLCFRGNIFLDEKAKRELEILIKAVLYTTNVQIDSNQFYYVEKLDGRYILRLQKSEANTHEVVWKKLNELIIEIKNCSEKRSDEYTILNNIIKINSQIGATYPSKLRNKVNYQPLFGLKAIEKSIHKVFQQDNWYDVFLYPIKNLSLEDNHAKAMYSYTKYIEWFCNNLISEYYEYQGKENGILKNINKTRSRKITMPELQLKF